MALYFTLGLIFVRVSVLPELLVYFLGVNTYVLYFLAPPAILGWLITGAYRRSFRARPIYLWVAFFAWMIVATVFSSWIGGSVERVLSYGRTDFLFLLLVSGLAVTWRDVRAVMTTLAAAGVFNLLTARVFAKATNGRLALNLPFDGIISNSNDLAAHLIFVLPFVLFVAMKTRNIVLRLVLLAGAVYGLTVILGTASRGALVGVVAAFLFFMLRASTAQRAAMLAAAPIVVILLLAVNSQATLHRLGTLFGGSEAPPGVDDEAAESMSSRSYLFKKSVIFTLTHPLFGVGPNQFANYEGRTSQQQGQHGNWHETHCAYTEVSSECGIPAFLFFVGALVGVYRLVSQTYRKAREKGHREIAQACLCYSLCMIGYMATLTFLASAYRFTLPTLVGLGVAIHFAAQKQLDAQPARSAVVAAV